MRSLFLLCVLAAAARPAPAQDASPYLPLGHWAMPYVEHLIAAGWLADPSPLTRPLRQEDVVRALRAVDRAAVPAAVWRVTRRLVSHLERRERGPWGRVDVDAGVAAATHALRDPLETRCRPDPAGCLARDPGVSRGLFHGGVAVQLGFGPLVAVTHPYFDTRLKHDPDYFGIKDRAIAGRNAEAYFATAWRFGELFFGALDREWGPRPAQSLLLSASPYGSEHLALGIGTRRVRFEGVLTQLDDLPDTGGVANRRYFVAHRLVLRPPGGLSVSLWEGTVLSGRDRALEPWYANILNLALLAQYDYHRRTPSNNQLGADVETHVGRARVFTQFLVDDFQVDDEGAGDAEPPSYGLTLGVELPLGPGAWTAWYTRVTNLAYRTHNPTEAVMRRHVGLARNFADYDQLTLRGGLLLGPGVLLAPELTLLRQGEGDFRQPYPSAAAFDSTPTFLAGTVERTFRAALAARFDGAALGVALDAGVHVVRNADHVPGARDTRFVGRVEITWKFKMESLLP
jgi:hypothetical protein